MPEPGEAPIKDRLLTTLFLAALFHGIVILGVSFSVAGLSDPDALPTLEVLLVNNDLPEARSNPQADYLAQRSQQGAGNTTERQRPTSPSSSQLAADNPGIPQGDALTDREAGRSAGAPDLLASNAPGEQAQHFADTQKPETGAPQTALLLHSGPASPLPSSDESEQLLLRGRQLRELLITPNTRESGLAVYLNSWKRKVERVGTVHFPQQARRQGLSGSPVLEVAIRSNGVLEDIIIRRTSGHAELDQAALSILKLATPFDPFPPALAERHDVLRFAYEWQFLGGALVNSSVSVAEPPQ